MKYAKIYTLAALVTFCFCRNHVDFAAAAQKTQGPAATSPLNIGSLPQTVTVVNGQRLNLSLTVSGGVSPIQYVWQKNGVEIAGATLASILLPPAVSGDNDAIYSVTIIDATGEVLTSSTRLRIVTAPNSDTLLSSILNFAETGVRNWNFGGHNMDFAEFNESRGFWDYADATFEPWLYDRPYVWRLLHNMTADGRWQLQADQDLAYYESRLGSNGLFLNKGDDAKYSYVHTWSTNTAKAQAAYQATLAAVPNVADFSGAALWTERQMWFALDAAVKYYVVSGNASALVRAKAIVDQWDTVCAGRGAPLVTYTRHEGGGPGGTQPTDLVTSPWMAALYFQAARLYMEAVPAVAPQIRRQASDYFDWLNVSANRGFYPGAQASAAYAAYVIPGYLAGGTMIGDAAPSVAHMEHGLDMAGFIAFAIRSKQALSLPTADAEVRLAQMKLTAERVFADTVRTTTYLPRYRLSPPRKLMWWLRGLYELRVNE